MSSPSSSPPSVDVIIIGAGPAGLACASHCASQGRSFLLLEARARLGGRVFTDTQLGAPIDVGASWIHHYGQSNPMARAAWDARVVMGVPEGGAELWMPRGDRPAEDCVRAADVIAGAAAFQVLEDARCEFGEKHCAQIHRHSAFEHVEFADYIAGMEGNAETIKETIALMDCDARAGSKQCGDSDQSYAEFLKQFPSVVAAQSPAPDAGASIGLNAMALGVLRSYLREESLYEGCALEQLSAAHTGEQLEDIPECDMQTSSGYGALLLEIARKEKLDQHVEFDTVVTAIDTAFDGVTVHARKLQPHERPKTQHGSSLAPNESPVPPAALSADAGTPVTFRGKYVLVTVPLGVLKRKSITFTPALPAWKQHAIDCMGFGLLNKVILQFDAPFWEEVDEPQLINGRGGKVNVLNILQAPEEPPLWIVNLSRPLHAAAARAKAGPLTEEKYAAALASYRPLALQYQEGQAYVAGNVPEDEEEEKAEEQGSTVPASAAPAVSSPSSSSASTVAASASAPAPASASSSSSPPLHILVSFTSNFDSSSSSSCDASAAAPSAPAPGGSAAGEWNSSTTEIQSDSAIVGHLMTQLRRAFQGGIEKKISAEEAQEANRTIHVSLATADSTVAYSHPVAASSGSASFAAPVAFSFSNPSFAAAPRSIRSVPDPVGYLVSRWGLEAFSHGAYAHYKKGSGPHTAALLGKAVQVQRKKDGQGVECVEEEEDSSASAAAAVASAASSPLRSTRLLFAGEATLGVHLGCADSAWLSGLREAKRIDTLWDAQEQKK